MKTKKQIATEAKQLADALASESFGLVGRPSPGSWVTAASTLRALAMLIHDLATVDATARICTRPKCSEPATSVTSLCVGHSVKSLGDSIDRARKKK